MITSFKLFESNLEIEKICKNLGIEDFQIVDGLVNVLGDVSISDRELTRIPVKFGRVDGNFGCYNNQLTSLEGSPQSVGGDFWCNNNQLTSLEGAPQSVGGYFDCINNQLTHLKGSPQSVGGNFNCNNNKLTTFRGIPEYSLNEEKSFYCNENPIHEIYYLFRTPKCIDLINEYEVIGDGVISRVRLEEVFVELGLEVPKNFKFGNYKLI